MKGRPTVNDILNMRPGEYDRKKQAYQDQQAVHKKYGIFSSG